MIRFQQKSRPRNYFSPREQRRLLFLVLSLGLFVILICEARKPGNWQWMQNLAGQKQEDWQWRENTDAEQARETADGLGEKETPSAADRLIAGVDRELLKTVEDNTRSRNEEKAAWFNLLGVLQRNDEGRLRRSSIGRVSWLQLYEQSAEYRGELVTVRGTVRRADRVAAPENDENIGSYYRVWLQPDDNRTRPIAAYCLQLPKDFPIGAELHEPADITGFYFKRWVYMGQKDLQTAPLLLAKTVSWKRPAAVKRPPPAGFKSVYFVIAAGAAGGLAAFAFIAYCTRRRPRKETQPPADLNLNTILAAEEKTKEEHEK